MSILAYSEEVNRSVKTVGIGGEVGWSSKVPYCRDGFGDGRRREEGTESGEGANECTSSRAWADRCQEVRKGEGEWLSDTSIPLILIWLVA